MRIVAVAVIVAMILSQSFLVCGYASSREIDATAVAVKVHDGDTFYLDRVIKGSSTVRLADINASELGQPLSYEARDFLKGLVFAKTVYLDIDDIYIYDYHGTGDRLVCVVYVVYNSTHYENVNKALWAEGLAERKEYDNEFNADTWTLYVPKTDLTPDSPLTIPIWAIVFVIVLTAVIGASIFYLSGRRHKSHGLHVCILIRK